MVHMEQLPLVSFRRAVLTAANGGEGSLRWDGLMDNQSVSSHSQGSAAKHRDTDRPPRETDRKMRSILSMEFLSAGGYSCSSRLLWTEVTDKQQSSSRFTDLNSLLRFKRLSARLWS